MAKSFKYRRGRKTYEPISNENFELKLKNLSLSINLVVFVMALIYIYLAYNYLANLKSCKCAEGKYVERVKNAEGILMAIVLIWIIMSFWIANNLHTLSRESIMVLLFVVGAIGIFTFLVYIYFCYNVHKMQKSLTTNCLCAMKWQRWLIYIQYGFFLYEIALVVISVIIGIVYMLLHIS
jgi:hypothetical protein